MKHIDKHYILFDPHWGAYSFRKYAQFCHDFNTDINVPRTNIIIIARKPLTCIKFFYSIRSQVGIRDFVKWLVVIIGIQPLE